MAEPTRPGFSILVCPDPALSLDWIGMRLTRHKPANGQWKRLVFWGDEEPGSRFWDSLNQCGLFAENRAMIVRNAQDWNSAIWKELSGALSQDRDYVWLFLCLEVDYEKGKFKVPAHIQKARCFNFADERGWIWRNQGLNQGTLRRHVEMEVKKMGLNLDADAISLFCESARPDAAGVKNELEKLAMISKNGKVDASMISRDSSNPESDAFACVRKLQNGDLADAWREMARTEASAMLFFLVALLARDLRQLWKINQGENVYIHPAEAGMKRKLAARMGAEGMARGFATLVDAEWQVKGGKLSPEQALEYLATEMVSIFAPGKNQNI